MTARVVIVGGGLAGLAAAVHLARGGAEVTVFEKGPGPGGRAAAQGQGGFTFNQGPHALYRGGAGIRALEELGIHPKGGIPPASGAALIGDPLRRHTLPAGPVSLLSTGLLTLGGKLETGRWIAALRKVDPTPLGGTSVRGWIDATFKHAEVRLLVEALIRVSTYANAPEQLSAGLALAQVQAALRSNVLYLDGGWQALVDALRDAAGAAGATLTTGARVAAVETARGAVTGVRLADGTRLACDVVVVTGSPAGAAALLGTADGWSAPAEWTRLRPIHAACLDVALRELPRPRAGFALGIDRPLYYSVHSRVARLAPDGGAVIHVARYLAPDADGAESAAELESVLDLMQPGWRDLVVERRFLPNMTVSHALPEAAHGGLAGRPGVVVPWISGAFVAGDWVGADGHLADASLASAREAAQKILAAAGLAEQRAA
jgi:phytoene dehydrogenase-like protein